MADPGPKVNVPVIDPSQYLSEVAKGLHRIVQDAFRDGYRMGYGEAEGKAIARIIEVVRSSAAGQDAAAQLTETRPRDAPGAATHELIESVLRARSPASPADIFRAPWNEGRISRQAIAKVLRRGARPGGRYQKAGHGRYSLKVGVAK